MKRIWTVEVQSKKEQEEWEIEQDVDTGMSIFPGLVEAENWFNHLVSQHGHSFNFRISSYVREQD